MKVRHSGKIIRRSILYFFMLIAVWITLAQCFIMKERWSDEKAYSVFKSKNIPLKIYDTLINNHHLHYAVCGDDALPTLVFVHGSPGSWMHYMKYMWDGDLRKKFRIVAIDRPGFGYSDFGKAMRCRFILDQVQRRTKERNTMLEPTGVGAGSSASRSTSQPAGGPALDR